MGKKNKQKKTLACLLVSVFIMGCERIIEAEAGFLLFTGKITAQVTLEMFTTPVKA